MKKKGYKMVLYSMNIVDQKITTENKKNTETISDTLENHSYSILKIEFDNKLLILKMKY